MIIYIIIIDGWCKDMIDNIQNAVTVIANTVQTAGPALGFLLIILESIIPILPLGVFVAFNVLAFGPIIGFIISWIATIIGCVMSFYAFRLGFSKILYTNLKMDGKAHKFMKYASHMSLDKLTILIALPFTPAFLVNISAGLSKMSFKKFFTGIVVGKIAVIYFWGYIGKSFINSLKDPIILIEILPLLGITYLISKLIQKYINKDADSNKILKLSRYVTIIIGVIAIVAALFNSSTVMWIQANMVGILGSMLAMTVLIGFAWKRSNSQGALAGMIVGILTAVVWYALGKPLGWFPILPAIFTSSIANIVVSLMTPPPSQEIVDKFFSDQQYSEYTE